ncbi:YihY/virulence factor BrkB family protein [Rhizorhabdus dicambivorans]|uniref:Ribonuclease BN n=1 Tax=Rhizorhabdus dicambivorans TaxID=1850238 RepID=A0A2A4G080_9SPHN|nr:YhjD/YihY/BrkB family envelope integrity protein [Rhizorhabdus dicambivorans]ATE65930.1 ribonuclease BN [Rhizorhabdus dicambivorans]PCE43164.1 ribonuclease BN [Rhizorhabdus dicambivorans]
MSDESPEARHRRPFEKHLNEMRPGGRLYAVVRRAALGVYADGFIHAGNIAYLALLTMFPFFIVMAALAQLFGRTPDVQHAVYGFLATVPPSVRELVAKPIEDVLAAQNSGALLWLGALVGLWTVGSFVETIRDILQRAYGTKPSKSFWHYRAGSILIILASVVLAMSAFSAQVVLTGIEQFVWRLLPFGADVQPLISLTRIAPLLMLMAALYAMFATLTPLKYRLSPCPKWPGALFTALWWMAVTMLLPMVVSLFGGYGRTYGSLAGVIVTLLFFWLVGLGLVFGAHLNAALAESPETSVKDPAPTK